MEKKLETIPYAPPPPKRAPCKRYVALTAALATAACFWSFPALARVPHGIIGGGGSVRVNHDKVVDAWCPLSKTPSGAQDGLEQSSKFLDEASIAKQVERLSAAIRVPTESHDDNGDVDVDPRYKTFYEFHDTLAQLFPLVHEKLQLEKINKYGLLYTFPGSSSELKPALFMAHQDVVPATNPERWAHPPYEPYYDGKFLWGRGSVDCKTNLIGILSAVEDLLEQDFQPKRTLILSFGFDEEVGGDRGAYELAAELNRRYEPESIAFIIDEGGMGLTALGDHVYALPGVGEKGYADLLITVSVDGGHSSRPPPHTGIGIMAELISELEANPYSPRLTQDNPFRGLLECQAKYSPKEVEPWLRHALSSRHTDEKRLGTRLAKAREDDRFIIQTSQAVDIIRGGEKVNALPEMVTAAVNYRIASHDSVEKVKERAAKLLRPIAHKHHLSLDAFDFSDSPSGKYSAGSVTINTTLYMPPAPISPTTLDNPVWSLFSGTVRQVFEDIPAYKGKTVVPVGDIMTGNTDTRHYWDLTKNIYRFGPSRDGTRFNAHTIDERVEMVAHAEGVRFYYDLIRNFDAAEGF
ncbi:putative vacuolar carboxypeptidase Cps1 [Phyllosticta capitalensis]|uniref:Vacuolar carboxypeptidase Cps1 n=1 Tax=Phyllosticta capitalensis TaxID=121624 RepID=A0ABR1YW32_9PEZI